MTELKTRPTDASVARFLDGVPDAAMRDDCRALVAMMEKASGEPPRMWGSSIVGFGSYHYKYDSGREGDWFLTGFAPRKQDLTLYIMPGFERYGELLGRLGRHKTGKSCLYIKRLADVDLDVLEELVTRSVERQKSRS